MNQDEKDQLIQEIRNWIEIDEKIKASQKEIRLFKQEKKLITNALVDVMKTNEIEEINILFLDINNQLLDLDEIPRKNQGLYYGTVFNYKPQKSRFALNGGIRYQRKWNRYIKSDYLLIQVHRTL